MVLAQLSPNVPRSLSWVKVGTPIGFARRIAYKRLHSETRGPLPWPQRGLVLPAKSSPKEQPEEADARLRRVSASSGVAALLGCVTFFSFVEIALVRPTLRAFYTCKVWGCYHCSRYAWCIAKVFRAQVSKRLTFAPTVRSWYNIPTFPQRIAHNVSHAKGESFSSEATVVL